MRSKKFLLMVVFSLSVLSMTGCGASGNAQTEAVLDDEEQQEDIYQKAQEYLAQKDYASAINELEKIPDYKDVNDLLQDARYEYGISLYDKSQYAQAIEQLEQIPDYKDTESYLDKCRMELKYEKFDYDTFLTLEDGSTDTMTHKEIRECIEEDLEYLMYSTWYQQDDEDRSIVIDKYSIDGKQYGILSWRGAEDYTELDIFYMDDTENEIHVALTLDYTYMSVAEQSTMILSLGDMCYSNYSSSQEEEYASLNEEKAKQAECYLPGQALSDSLTTYVHYARYAYDKKMNTYVVVACTVTNNTSSNLQFVAANYFSLNNNGVITTAGTTDYDYTTLAPGGSFFTEITFSCPTITRTGDTFSMTMLVENAQIHLGPAPQNDNEINGFPGVYMESSYSFDIIYIITDAGDGTYNIIRVSDALGDVRQYENVELDDKNRFSMGNGKFLWNPEGCDFYRFDYNEEDYDRDNIITKENSYEP